MPKVHKNYSFASVDQALEAIKSEYYELLKDV